LPTITSHKQFQEVGKLTFCYVCTSPFVIGVAADRDHIPPQACFAKADRNVPLVLRTHVKCNHDHNANDELVGQLISLKHGHSPAARARRLNFEVVPSPHNGDFLAGFDNLDFGNVIRRWVRGFHAALYREPLSASCRFDVSLRFVEAIKINRVARNLDQIVSNNGKLQYDCVWAQSDDSGPWLCIFALNIYDWKDLGDSKHFPARGCVGSYVLPSGKPPLSATLVTKLQISISNFDVLDPFGR
jgi:hypothetical protein